MDFAQGQGPQGDRRLVHEGQGIAGCRARADIGSVALGDKERGYAIILLPGDSIEHPERLQMHFEVGDVDAEYDRLKRLGVEFDEPPEDQPWGWRHAYTHDPVGHTVELCTPLADAKLRK